MGSMDTLRAWLARRLALLLVVILVTVGLSIVAVCAGEASQASLLEVVGLLVVLYVLRPRLGRRSERAQKRHE